MDKIKATLRDSNGNFLTDLELIGYDAAPKELTLNIAGFPPIYKLESEDQAHTRANYQEHSKT